MTGPALTKANRLAGFFGCKVVHCGARGLLKTEHTPKTCKVARTRAFQSTVRALLLRRCHSELRFSEERQYQHMEGASKALASLVRGVLRCDDLSRFLNFLDGFRNFRNCSNQTLSEMPTLGPSGKGVLPVDTGSDTSASKRLGSC